MRRLAGQAARHGGRVLHTLAQLALALVVALCVALAGAAWRLARGPVELPWLVPVLQAAANADAPVHLSFGGAAVAWEGFRTGLDQPLDIRLFDVALTDADGRRILAVPRAALALSPGWLLLGRLVPRAIQLDGARLHVLRGADGAIGFDLPAPLPQHAGAADLPNLLRELAARPKTDQSTGTPSRWSQLRRLRIAGAALRVTDRQLGIEWSIPTLDIDLFRPAAGGVTGSTTASLKLGDVTAQLTANAALAADGQRTDLRFRLTPIVPTAIARLLPQAAALARVDAPVALSGSAELGPALGLTAFELVAAVGAGTLHIAEGTVPVLEAEGIAQGTPAHVTADLIRLVTAPNADGPRTTLTGHAAVTRAADSVTVTATVALDQVAFADLPALWPVGLGGPDTRPWITRNITSGIAHDVHVELALTAAADLSDATLTQLAGGGEGSDLTVHWLRPVPPIVHGAAHLNFLGPDALEVVATAGREPIGGDVIAVRGGRVLFTGLQERDQFADITADLSGPVPTALSLLALPRIGLLARSPIPVRDAAGQFVGHVVLTRLPMRTDVTMDDLQIRTALKLTGVQLPGIVAGRDLDRGTLDLAADPDGLHITGQAALAGIPAQLQADMDFRAGPPAQMVQTIAATGTVTTAQIAALGLDPAPYAGGSAQVSARLALRRNQTGEAAVTADLAGTALTVAALNWQKPPGQPARAEARLALDHDRIARIDSVEVEGERMRLAASAGFTNGRPDLVRLDRLELGSTTNLRGTIDVPRQPGEPWRADLIGASLDASAAFKRQPTAPKPEAAGPAYAITARFDRVVLGPDRTLAAVVASAENDGQTMRRLDLSGRPGGAEAFRVTIEPQATGRRLTANAANAGALLKALDVIPDMQGGRLVINGSYDDAAPGHPLAGRAEITDFRIRRAPALAKLLQAMTLYGLVDLIQGPGLGFSRLEAPFRLTGDVLELHDARAFSPSLGMTAKGQVDLARQSFDMEGTIVPAYFFNSLLGDLPIVGRLFSPERGGGVFAATYTLRGPMEDPRVSVNPLAALTPGFLRGLFGLFDRATGQQ